jgi:hypothetical protein
MSNLKHMSIEELEADMRSCEVVVTQQGNKGTWIKCLKTGICLF